MRLRFSAPSAARAAFTLVEVILAIGIATGILVVALVFYNQAANLRNQVIAEAERLSAIRLILDRITADLRAAFAEPHAGFTGLTDSMQFITAKAPDVTGSAASRFSAALGAASDLHRVYYFLTASLEGTNFVITGLNRTEEPWLTLPLVQALSEGSTGNSASVAAPTTFTTVAAPLGETNAAPAEPLAETIRFVRFRYWDGSAWLDDWESSKLPAAVEVSLGSDPQEETELPEAYPFELFRRVIVLPAARADEEWWAGL